MISMLVLLLLVLPFYHSYVALATKLPAPRAAAGAATLLAGGLLAFWRLGGAVPGIPAGHGLRMMSMLEVGGKWECAGGLWVVWVVVILCVWEGWVGGGGGGGHPS